VRATGRIRLSDQKRLTAIAFDAPARPT